MRLVVRGDEFGRSYDIPQGVSIIGRSPDCDISIPASTLSKRHLEIARQGSMVTIRDLDTTNGTYVNGLKIHVEDLNHNDVVMLGRLELVFDAGSGAEAGGGPVFFDEPGDTQPAVEQPPPAQEPVMPDGQPFDAGPGSSDDTPADVDFVPTVYQPEREHGPELIARGDRWFVRDPATNREVEIVPKGGGFARPDMDGYYAKQRSKKITQVVIAAVGLVVVVMAVLLIIPTGNDQPVKPIGLAGPEYDAALDEGIEALEKGNYATAMMKFSKAHENSPRREVAGIFKEITSLWENAGEDMADLEYGTAQNLLDDVQNHTLRTDKAERFATKWLDWMAQENRQRLILKKGQQQYANRGFEEAYKTLGALHDGPVRIKNADFIEQVRAACEHLSLSRARQLMANRDWDEASRAFEAAKQYLNDDQSVDQQIAACRLGREHKGLYDAAQNYFDRTDYGPAKAALERIPAGSPYDSDAQTMLVAVIQAEKLQRAEDLFDGGEAPKAIAYIEQEPLTSAGPLKELIRQTLQLVDAAETANKENRISDEIEAYEKIIQLLSDRPKNAYLRRARQRHDQLTADPLALARMYTDMARRALNNGQPEDARRYATLANERQGGFGDPVITELDRQGHILYNQAFVADQRGHLDEAEEKANLVLRYTTPDSKYYTRAVRLLNEIQQRKAAQPTPEDNEP